MSNKPGTYYVPAQSSWPIIGAFALFLVAVGAGMTVQGTQSEGAVGTIGSIVLAVGFLFLLYMLAGWFSNVITESLSGKYSSQITRSFRQGMSWFIFSEVMFFGAFFGALFYARMISVPWLGGADNNFMTNEVLWPTFEAMWPLTLTPGGETTQAMPWQGIPLTNTILLLLSSITLHMAHISLEKDKRTALIVWLEITIVLAAMDIRSFMRSYLPATLWNTSATWLAFWLLGTLRNPKWVTSSWPLLFAAWLAGVCCSLMGHVLSESEPRILTADGVATRVAVS